jgi:hypothetical protein
MQPSPEADAAAFLFGEGKREPKLLLQGAREDTANSQQELDHDPRRRNHRASDLTKASTKSKSLDSATFLLQYIHRMLYQYSLVEGSPPRRGVVD